MCGFTPQAPLLLKPCFSDMVCLPSANRRHDTLRYWRVITAEIQRHSKSATTGGLLPRQEPGVDGYSKVYICNIRSQVKAFSDLAVVEITLDELKSTE
jgi:hypothetical protein